VRIAGSLEIDQGWRRLGVDVCSKASSIYAVVVQLGEERAAIALQRNRLQKA
jgi:hypothetical protein